MHSPTSGRVLEIYTDSPGLQFYSGNMLDGSILGKGGVAYQQYGGFALETQVNPKAQKHRPVCSASIGYFSRTHPGMSWLEAA